MDFIKRQKNILGEQGFTLVEMMVAIAVFSVVMVTAMSALLNVIDADQKAQAIKTAINNVNFALEGISKDMRVGSDYGCKEGNNSIDPDTWGDCTGGAGEIIRYRSERADLVNSGDLKDKTRKFAYYRYVPALGTNPGKIQTCLDKGKTCSANSDFSDITSPEVNITELNFYVLNTSDDTKQPRMIMTLSGEAGQKAKIKTTFDLQTSVSQRTRQ